VALDPGSSGFLAASTEAACTLKWTNTAEGERLVSTNAGRTAMALFQTLRMVFWLSAVPALIAVSGAGPRSVPGRPANGDRLADAAPAPRLQNIGRIPLNFEANQGQTDRQVQYLARGPG